MQKRFNKKGFTLVELVIVIAVIGILSAVLIPTFSSLIKKANESADVKAVRQMNTVIAVAGETTNIDEVIDALAEAGYNSKKALIPVSSDYGFYWYESVNQIVLVSGETVVFPEGVTYDANGINLEDSVRYIDVFAVTASEVLNAINAGSESITLNSDITFEQDVNITEGNNITLDLNGHTIDSVQNSTNGRSSVIYIREGASLTVTNGTLKVRSLQNYGALTIKPDVVIYAVDTNGGGCIKNKTGNVIIEGGEFYVENYVSYENGGGAAVVENDGGTVTINGGTFKSATDIYTVVNLNGTITINGGSFDGYYGCVCAINSEVVINAGTFNYYGARGHHLYANNGKILYVAEAVEFIGLDFDGGCTKESGSIEQK